jgi:hypothetical protein
MRTDTAFKAVAIIGFKDGQGGVEHLAFGYDHDIKPGRDVVTTENLSYQSFRSVPLNGSAELFRRRDAQTPRRTVVGQDEHGCVAPVNPCAPFIHFLKLGTAANVFMRPEPSQRYSLLTVRRFRPFARRRLSTSRPFFVLIRTRNPCVFARWRVFGWNVRFPFMHSLLTANRQC